KLTGMHQSLIILFRKGSVLLIDIEIIVLVKIISHIEIGPAIEVDIGNSNAQSVTDGRTIDPCCPGNIGKMISVISVNSISGKRMIGAQKFTTWCKGSILVNRMIEQKKIKVSIMIIIEENSLGAKSFGSQ